MTLRLEKGILFDERYKRRVYHKYAASGAVDGSKGCINSNILTWMCQAEAGNTDKKRLFDCVPGHMYYQSLTSMPLPERGWAFQERLLPSITLHFTSKQVFWECYEKVACETFPVIYPLQLRYGNLFLRKRPLERSMWPWIVTNYSKFDLTRSEDKLVAISGLARNIQLQSGVEYVAGIWRDDLELQLCWSNIGYKGPKIRPYRAPTWSWASINGYIDTSHYELSSPGYLCIKILEVHVEPCGLDPLGGISSASLRLSCVILIHATIVMVEEDKVDDDMAIAGNSHLVDVKFDYIGNYFDTMLHVLPVNWVWWRYRNCGITLAANRVSAGSISKGRPIHFLGRVVFLGIRKVLQIAGMPSKGTRIFRDSEGERRHK